MSDTTNLSARLADAIREAACPGDCGLTEEECTDLRLQPVVYHHGVLAEVEGRPEQFAAAVLPVVEAEIRSRLAQAEPDESVHVNGVAYPDAATARAAGAFSGRGPQTEPTTPEAS